jgi:hypothetical protein
MPMYKVTLQLDERSALEAIVHKGSHASRTVVNALILLNCDAGEFRPQRLRNEDVAAVLKISLRKIDRVKQRFVEEGLEAAPERRPSPRVYQRKADGDFEAHWVALSCGPPPEGFCRWSLRLPADRAVERHYLDSVSHETVRRVLKEANSNRGRSRAGSSRPITTPTS